MYLEKNKLWPTIGYHEQIYKKRVPVPKKHKEKYPNSTIGVSWDNYYNKVFLYLVQNNEPKNRTGIKTILHEKNIQNVIKGISLNHVAKKMLNDKLLLEKIL